MYQYVQSLDIIIFLYGNTRLIYSKTTYNNLCFELYFFHRIIEFNQETPWFYKYTTLLFCYKNVCLVSGFPSNNFTKMGTTTTKLHTSICRTDFFLFLCPSRFKHSLSSPSHALRMDLAYLVQVSRTPSVLKLGFLVHPWSALIPGNRNTLILAIYQNIKQLYHG